MKIICKNNFGNEAISDILLAENVLKHYAKSMADYLNKRNGGPNSPYYFEEVNDDYELYEFKP